MRGREVPIQALDRTQPSLPITGGRAGTMTHDYKRHGTTTLFAALDVLTGKVIGKCFARHRHDEFVRFLRTIARRSPRPNHPPDRRQLRHPHPPQREGVAGQAPPVPPALHPDLLLLAEPGGTVVRDLTDKAIRRGVFNSVTDLIAAIERTT